MHGPTEALAWAASGAMALTGRSGRPPLLAPAGVVDRIRRLGTAIDVDPLPFLGERAAAAGLSRRGPVSCGGAAALVRAADGWLAVNLARDDDRTAVPAWLELTMTDVDWPAIERTVATRTVAELVARATLLALPIGAVGETGTPAPSADLGRLPVTATRLADRSTERHPPVVVDLSSLWAGPLATRLLADRGAQVVKVESTARPDGARRGPASFFDRLHAGQASVALDLESPAGSTSLRRLIGHADVVVEGSRPRALRQLGIEPLDVLGDEPGPAVWVSITGHGRAADRVGFGDDTAAAGGLVAWDHDGPCFVADAVADPLAGTTAAAATAMALGRGGRWLIDVSMAGVAAFVAGADRDAVWPPGDGWDAAPPRVVTPRGRARPFGADTDATLAERGPARP